MIHSRCEISGANGGDTGAAFAAAHVWRDLRPEPEFDQFAQLAATICDTPIATISIFSDGQQWMKGKVGVTCDVLPADETFCIQTVVDGAFLQVCDATSDSRFFDHPAVTGPDHIRFYAGEPLMVDGEAVGALCVVDTEPRPHGLGAEHRSALSMLAGQASLQLRLREALLERDATALQLRATADQLRWAATHDPMTGLGNRALLREALADLSAGGTLSFALLVIDVDHFKQINDSFGHQTGDALLKEIARRLVKAVRAADFVIRLGGDEFAIIVHDLADESVLTMLATRILETMREPFVHEERRLECRISVGGARWPLHTTDISQLVRFADAALYEAKARGRGVFVLFEQRLVAEQSRRSTEIERARAALDHHHIVPFYQPKVDLADGTILGVEALLRLVEPGGMPTSPHMIAAAFDEPEIAQEIGSCLLGQILGDMRSWLEAGLPFGRVAVNVSATEIGDPTYPRRLIAALDDHGISPHMLELEIIENVLLDQRSSAVLASVRALSQAGVRIAFDDFGTGYAALAHLPNFPVDTIKIDQTFVRNLDRRANQAIVRALLSLAHELGLEAIAEGVETTRQAADLIALGCTVGQGFLYSEAIPGTELARILQSRRQSVSNQRNIMLADRLSLARQAA